MGRAPRRRQKQVQTHCHRPEEKERGLAMREGQVPASCQAIYNERQVKGLPGHQEAEWMTHRPREMWASEKLVLTRDHWARGTGLSLTECSQ